MPTPFVSVCPHCRAKLKLKNPDLIGKTARCPSCEEQFVVKKAEATSSPASAAKPKSKPLPDPDDELDPWLQDDLDSYAEDADGPLKSTGKAAGLPPAVTGVSKKETSSAAGGGKKKRRKSESGSLENVAWLGWVVGGSIAGLLGAAVWGAIGAWTFSELGILAWAIGGFVGFGVRVGAKEDDVGLAPGVTAVLIALASVVLGKFLWVHFLTARMEHMIAQFGDPAEAAEMTEEETIDWILDDYASEIQWEWEEQGRELNTPDWESLPEEAPTETYYDPDVWAEAEKRWNDKTDDEQAAEILNHRAQKCRM